MDNKAFFKILGHYKWILIFIPIVAAAITYFLVEDLPRTYSSEVQIATGIVDKSKQVSGNENDDYFRMVQQFNNIIEQMQMKKITSILSYNLILHDLENPKAAFKPYSEMLDSLSEADRQKVIEIYKEKLNSKSILNLADNDGPYKLFEIIASMGYDEVSLKKNLTIEHADNSDFITIKYVSPDPLLSAFVVNTLAGDFINNYGIDVNRNQNESIVVLDSLLKEKERLMNDKNSALKDFKMSNGVLNLDKQSELVYQQITQAEDKKANVIREIQANQGAINDIERKLRSSDPNTGSNISRDNSEIVNIRNQLQIANKRYVDGGFKFEDKLLVDSLQAMQQQLTARSSEKYIVDPLISRQNLQQTKNTLETSVAQLNSSVMAIDRELATARSKYNAMVPFDANIQNYMRDADMATKDYLEALNRYNQTRTDQNIGFKLQIAQFGLPGSPEPSKTMLFVGLSAAASLFICIVVLLILFLMDNTINTGTQLELATKTPVLGGIYMIPETDKAIKSILDENEANPDYVHHKGLLRSIRFELARDLALDNSKILGITSLNAGAGKTFVASNLAYSFAMIGKKVLLIGGEQPGLNAVDNKKKLNGRQKFETFLIKREIQDEDLITRLTKIDANKSLLEIQGESKLRAAFEMLSDQFDIVIIDISSLTDLNVAKEWLSFTDKNIAVFEAGKSIDEADMESVNYLKSQPGFMGWVLNKMKPS